MLTIDPWKTKYGWQFTALFSDFYAADAIPGCLLFPPECWAPGWRAC